MLDGGFHQQPDQVAILQHRAGRDDWPGDLDLVQGQDIDQRPRRPVGVRQLVGEAATDFALGLDHQAHEDVVEQRLHRLGVQGAHALGALAQVGDGEQKPLAIPRGASLRQLHQTLGLTRDAQKRPSGKIPN